MIWVKYETWDYMDEFPEYGYRLCDDYKQALEWAEYMQDNYSGGTTRIMRPAYKEELLKFIEDNNLQLDEKTLQNVNNNDYYRYDKYLEDHIEL